MEFKNYPFVKHDEIMALLEGAGKERLTYLAWLYQMQFEFYQSSPFYLKKSVEKHKAHLDFFQRIVAEIETRLAYIEHFQKEKEAQNV
ncbi:MAG: hypothetical protein EAZ63_03630 [Runella slithyformis]|nr:MAG: hypothetical protein EAZ63_03630 [Runella slithyformis]